VTVAARPAPTASTTTTACRCGNSIVEAGEQCDDGNLINTDACTNVCTLPPTGVPHDRSRSARPPRVRGCRSSAAPTSPTPRSPGSRSTRRSRCRSRPTTTATACSTCRRPGLPPAQPGRRRPASWSCTSPAAPGPFANPPAGRRGAAGGRAVRQSERGTCLSRWPTRHVAAGLHPGPSRRRRRRASSPRGVGHDHAERHPGGRCTTPHRATYSGNPAQTLLNGLLMGFISEADANATILPATLPLIGGKPLSIVLPAATRPAPTATAPRSATRTPTTRRRLVF